MEKEYFSEREKEELNKLLAKRRRVERKEKEEKEFFEQVDQRKKEILQRWGLAQKEVSESNL